MKRALLAFFSTVAGLVALLSFKSQAVTTPETVPAALAPAAGGTTAAPPTATPTTGSTADPSGAAPSDPAAPATGAAPAAADGTYTGDAASTRYGPVQVEITVSGGRVTAVQAVDYPRENPRDAEINSRAVPELNQEAVDAGTASIDVVSGATYTSDGYIASLQSALDQAGL